MTARDGKSRFAARPGDAEAWVRTADPAVSDRAAGGDFTARLTIDITPELRGRIKVAAFRRGITVADMLRALFAREFPDSDGGAP